MLTAVRAVVLATGSEAALPPIPGLADSSPWTNREATTSKRVPDRLIVLGGGVVGVELGQAWHSLGAQVTIVEAMPRLLGREELFAAEQVHAALVERGIDVRVGEPAVEIVRDGAVRVRLEGGDEVVGDELLVAVGRRPATRELGLETVGLEPGRYVEVDDRLRAAGSDWLYAIGDVNGRALLTHMGKYQARIASDVILGRDAMINTAAVRAACAARRLHRPAGRRGRAHPRVGAGGRLHALEPSITRRPVWRAAASTAAAPSGTSRLVVDEDRRVLVGATFTGPDVAEFVHVATVAIVGELTLDQLWHATPSFPTRSEVWLRLLETYGL